MSVNQQTFGRRSSISHAQIEVSGRPPVICYFREVSKNAGVIDLLETTWLPFRFVLRLHGSASVLSCEIKHQKERWLSVRLLDSGNGTGARDVLTQTLTPSDSWIGTGDAWRENPGKGLRCPLLQNRTVDKRPRAFGKLVHGRLA